MNKLAFALIAGTALVAASPAAAQNYQNRNYSAQALDVQLDRFYDRLFDGIESGLITRTESQRLRVQLRDLIRLEARYSANGLTRQERADLDARVRALRQDFRVADNGRGRFADAEDEDREEENNYRQVNQVCGTPQGGFGGLLATLLGSDNCLRVGERVTNNSLYGLPNQYRDEFRDTNTHYYRYLEGNVIEIEIRTGVVTRIFQVA
jgi:hypothetical protein